MKKQNEQRLVPQLRFKGFNEDWEQCKLKDILKVNSGRNYKHLAKGDIPVYGTGGLIARVDDFLSNQPAVGLGRKGTIDNPFFLEPPFWTVDTLFYLTSEKDNHINFIFYLLLRIRWKKYDESTGVPSLSKKTIENINVFSTKFEEQIKIAKILEKINDLINLHNKKLKFLKKLENAYSVCLFAFKSNAPLVRFSNFNNDWEMFKVKDLFTVTRGQVLSVDKISKFKTDNNKFPVYSSQTHNNGLLGYYHDFLFDTAITWTTDGANAGTVKFRSGKFYSTNVNGVLISDDGYACEAVAKIIEKETPRWVVRVGNPKLMNNVMSDITIKISSDVNELEKISNIFVKINTLIELEKDIIEKYENLKKEYLNYLFI
ncbi:restriction endonuclease subunit S [Nosocomiicoccus ampullae]|uniref:restriction endonuclease subunit S n=1 Tax=Nosocomiicoccus ampullae TaxID=489910 RepID=UPI001C5DC618|nr:restriction endonuclease subunit S [Nosocomiicoccus ampullae]QYA48273.1 restriction endonuclease subunit S [Nosocomiicoccus ampullae]